MSDGKLFSKSKSVEIRAELERVYKKSKPQNRIKVVLKKVVANIILNNNEIINLFPDIIELMRIDDIEIRKVCLQYLQTYGRADSKVASRAIPFLIRFKDDHDPILRSLTVKTITSVPNQDYLDLGFLVCRQSLRDSDAHVRKTAAYSVSRLFQHTPERVLEEGLIGALNELLYDSNESVVVNTLASLNFITENGKHLNINIDRDHVLTLISYLSKTNEWSQIYILNSLMAFVPQTTQEALSLIDAVMPSLQHQNSAVILNAVKVITYYSNYVKNPELVIPTLSKRLASSLASLLSKPSEIEFLVLRNVTLLLLGRKELVNFDVEMFFCRYDDPIYVKDTKLEIIYLLANELNVHVVLRELEEYATEVDIAMARKAIRAFGNLAIKIESAADQCVKMICDLVTNGIGFIVQEASVVIKNIIRRYPGRFNFAIQELIDHYKLIDEPDAKASTIWILGQYCENISNVETIFEDFLANFKEEPVEVQYATLTAVTKLYLKLPQKGEKLLIQILKWATEDVDNPDIRDRGLMYWRLLSHEAANGPNNVFQEATKKIILDTSPTISTDTGCIDPSIIEELELNIGTLASIYLKPVPVVFRHSKAKKLPYSPALEPRTSDKHSGSPSKRLPESLTVVTSFTSEYEQSRRFHSQTDSRGLPTEKLFDSPTKLEPSSASGSLLKKESFTRRLSNASFLPGRKNKN